MASLPTTRRRPLEWTEDPKGSSFKGKYSTPTEEDIYSKHVRMVRVCMCACTYIRMCLCMRIVPAQQVKDRAQTRVAAPMTSLITYCDHFLSHAVIPCMHASMGLYVGKCRSVRLAQDDFSKGLLSVKGRAQPLMETGFHRSPIVIIPHLMQWLHACIDLYVGKCRSVRLAQDDFSEGLLSVKGRAH